MTGGPPHLLRLRGHALPRTAVLLVAAATLGVAVVASTATPTFVARSVSAGPFSSQATRVPPTHSAPTATASSVGQVKFVKGRHSRWSEIAFTILGVTVSVATLVLGLAILAILAAAAYTAVRGITRAARVRIEIERLEGLPSALPEDPARARATDRLDARQVLGHGSVRDDVIACWADLEDAAEGAGAARLAFETSTQFADRLGSAREVDAASLEALLGLFREARFSEHDLPESARTTATATLERLQLDLELSVSALRGSDPS